MILELAYEKYWNLLYGMTLTIFVLLKVFVLPSKGNVEVKTAGIYSETENIEKKEMDTENGSTLVTNDSFDDNNIHVKLKQERIADTDVYFVDIQLNSMQYLKAAFAKNTYGRNINEPTSKIAEEHGAIVAINGDFYGFRDYGYVIRNGVLYRSNYKNDTEQVFAIYDDGRCETFLSKDISAQQLMDNGAIQMLSFGPALVENGVVTVQESDPDDLETIAGRNPRTAIGMIEPLHYVFVVVDGRTRESVGYTFYELANVMLDYGCIEAYNLDGGGSSTLYFNGKVINTPTDGITVGEREVSDIVYIGY